MFDDEEEVVQWAEGREKSISKFIKEKDQNSFYCNPLKADIYQMAAMGVDGTFFEGIPSFDDVAMILGLRAIPLTQIIGPLAIMIWAIYSIDWSKVEIGAPFDYERGSDTNGVSRNFRTVLAALVLFLFCLYSLSSAKADDANLMKLRLLCWTMDGANEDNWILLYIGPFINSWIFVMTCCDMFLIFFLAESPMDVVFDSFGLLFLFNLDDIPGQIDALLPDWPADTAGNVYWYRVHEVWKEHGFSFEDFDHNTEDQIADPDYAFDHASEIKEEYGIGINPLYLGARVILRPMLIVLPAAYLLLNQSLGPKKES